MSLKSDTFFSLEISLKRNHVYRRTARAWTNQPNKTGQPRRGAANVFFCFVLRHLKSLKLPVPGMSVQVFVGWKITIGSVMVDYPSQSFVRFLGRDIFSYKLGPWKSLLPSFAKIMSLSFPFGWWSTEKPLKKWWKRENQPCNFLNLIFF